MYHIKIDENNVILDATSFYVDDYIHTNLDVIPSDIIQGYYKWIDGNILLDEQLKLEELQRQQENMERE